MVCLAVSYAAHAQAPDKSIEAALQSLHMRAAVAFRGEVLAVQRVGGVVEVQFRVDEWLKGGAGSAYLLREWAGLWAAGERRYRVGQRVVLFLHAAGASGMASPVDGLDGVLPMADADAGAALTPVQAVSVERLRTRVLRSVGTNASSAPLTFTSADEQREVDAITAPRLHTTTVVLALRLLCVMLTSDPALRERFTTQHSHVTLSHCLISGRHCLSEAVYEVLLGLMLGKQILGAAGVAEPDDVRREDESERRRAAELASAAATTGSEDDGADGGGGGSLGGVGLSLNVSEASGGGESAALSPSKLTAECSPWMT